MGESCYVVVDTLMNAAAARSKCREYGGYLTVIDDAQENQFVGQLLYDGMYLVYLVQYKANVTVIYTCH